MYKKTSLILLIAIAFKAQATVHTVSNLPNSGAMFNDINTAISAATNGDTIYVMGSNTTYANVTLNKNVWLIGPGTFAQKEYVIPATVNLIDLEDNLNGAAVLGFNCNIVGGSNIQNIEIGYNQLNGSQGMSISFSNQTNISNIHIHSNILKAGPISSNIAVTFASSTLINNIIFENNICVGTFANMNGNFVFVQHNVFYNCTYNGDDAFGNTSNCIINNNIFYNSDPLTGTTSCSYNNNISYSSTATFPAMPAGNGNIDNTNPMMVNVFNSGSYSPTLNFALQAGSPALNTGNDGTNMGITGGNNTSTVTGEVYNMPVIRKMMIQNTSVPQNGNIDVKVRSTKSRTN